MCGKLTQCGTILSGYADEPAHDAANQKWCIVLPHSPLLSSKTITKFDIYFRKIKHQIMYLNITTVPKIAWRGLCKDTDGQEAKFMPNLTYLRWVTSESTVKSGRNPGFTGWTVWFRKMLQSDSKTHCQVEPVLVSLFWVGMKLASINNSHFKMNIWVSIINRLWLCFNALKYPHKMLFSLV